MLFEIFRFNLFIFIFMIGAEFILKDTYLDNLCRAMHFSERETMLMKKTAKIPYDGLILTFVLCQIPVFNILYLAFIILVGLNIWKINSF